MLSDQLADLLRGRMRRFDPFELEAERIELDAHVVDDLRRRSGEGRDLVLEPQFGLRNQAPGILRARKVGPLGHFHLGVFAQDHRHRDQREQSDHDPGKADAVDDQARQDREREDRRGAEGDVTQFLDEMVASHLGRMHADRRHPPMASALAIVAHERTTLAEEAVAVLG